MKNVDNYQEMPILNKKSYPHITPYGVVTKQYSRILLRLFRHKIFADGLFWYVEVENIHSFNEYYLQQSIPPTIVQLVQKNKIKLIICNFAESFVNIIEPLYNLLVTKFGIDESSLILITGARDIENEISRVSTALNKRPIKTILSSDCEESISYQEKINPVLHHKENFEKKYICLNRSWRLHRPLFVSLLAINDLLKDGYVSLIENDRENWSTKFDSLVSDFPCYSEFLNENEEKIRSLTPLTVDRENLEINPDWHDPSMSHIYNTSYFSVACETNFKHSDTRFLTEKTYKTIVHRHPLILLSVPKSLVYLREKGYKTFHPYINESYDNELDDQKRLSMVLQETKRLCSLTGKDLEEFLAETKKICTFNYNLLINKTSFHRLLVDNK